MYVGGSVNIESRFGDHKRGAGADVQAIDRAILKYGKENFTYQIITELPADWKIIGEHEKYWIKFYNTFKDGKHYNLDEGGGGISGFKHSDESKKKMSDAKKGKYIGENHPMWNKHHSKETKNKISQAKKGKFTGEKSHKWKDYARITKRGFGKGKQQYAIRFNGKYIKVSISIDKLVKWFNENYPDEELVIGEGIKSQ